MGVKISERIEKKLLDEHDVTRKEVIECFVNMQFTAIKETREQHDTDPPTLWIISETNHRRRLKVLFMVKDSHAIIKSAYDPEPAAESIYRKKAQSIL